jgi:hypothetical protein
MRIAGIVTILLGTANCTSPPPQVQPEQAELSYDIAYESVEGGFKGMALFIDPTEGVTWAAFRDERDAVSKEGPGETLFECGNGVIGCFKEAQLPPLLSALPPAGFLDGAYQYTARPIRFWASSCTEIAASSERATTTSVVCPVVGLVQFSYSVDGNDEAERYQLKSLNGLFARR